MKFNKTRSACAKELREERREDTEVEISKQASRIRGACVKTLGQPEFAAVKPSGKSLNLYWSKALQEESPGTLYKSGAAFPHSVRRQNPRERCHPCARSGWSWQRGDAMPI